MSPIRVGLTAALALISSLGLAQIDHVTIAAGTPEDKDLTTIGNEQDLQKKIAMFQDFLQKYSSNPMAVAFGNWQLAQTYQSAGDFPKAADAADKALVSSPRNLDILTSQVAISQQMHDGARVFKYAVQGGGIYNSIDKQTKPENMSDEGFRDTVETEKQNNQNAYQFFQSSAFSVIGSETNAKTRMDYIEQFTATFPRSGLDEQLLMERRQLLPILKIWSRSLPWLPLTCKVPRRPPRPFLMPRRRSCLLKRTSPMQPNRTKCRLESHIALSAGPTLSRKRPCLPSQN